MVAERGVDRRAVGVEGRQDVAVDQLDGGHRRAACWGGAWPQAKRAWQSMAVFWLTLAHALEHAEAEGVHRDQAAGVRRLDVALAKLGAEALQAGSARRTARADARPSSAPGAAGSGLVSRPWRCRSPADAFPIWRLAAKGSRRPHHRSDWRRQRLQHHQCGRPRRSISETQDQNQSSRHQRRPGCANGTVCGDKHQIEQDVRHD